MSRPAFVAVPHPDKGGAPAPLLLPPGQPATVYDLQYLYRLLIYVERELAAGPFDRWDGAVLDAWRDIAKDKIRECETDLAAQLEAARERAYRRRGYLIDFHGESV
jgi:hypothetical protein